MGKCLFMRKGETHTEPSVYIGDPVFANNDWATIIEACQKNKIHPTWEIGDSKTMTIEDTDYAIDIIGKNHDDYADGSGKAPLTFQMHDCYKVGFYMNAEQKNSGGWTSCNMRNTHLPTVIALMPTEVQVGIKEVSKLTGAGLGSYAINTTADKLFLLSEIEVVGTNGYSASGEGTQYDYYKAGNSAVKTVVGTKKAWWLRSPYIKNATHFCRVGADGGTGGSAANGSDGAAFAFCF